MTCEWEHVSVLFDLSMPTQTQASTEAVSVTQPACTRNLNPTDQSATLGGRNGASQAKKTIHSDK